MKKTFQIFFDAILLFIVAGIVCYLTTFVASLFGIELKEQRAFEYIKNLRGLRLLILVAYALILAPIIEEFVFRYLLFRLPQKLCSLFKIVAGKNITVLLAIISSILFTAVHYLGKGAFPDNAFVGLFAVGMYQCRLYDKRKSLARAMLNHSLFNTLNLAVFYLVEVL